MGEAPVARSAATAVALCSVLVAMGGCGASGPTYEDNAESAEKWINSSDGKDRYIDVPCTASGDSYYGCNLLPDYRDYGRTVGLTDCIQFRDGDFEQADDDECTTRDAAQALASQTEAER